MQSVADRSQKKAIFATLVSRNNFIIRSLFHHDSDLEAARGTVLTV